MHELPSDPAIDAAMAAGAFGQNASVLFTGKGCLNLSQEISPPADQADLRKLLQSLTLYDIDHLYVSSDEPIASANIGNLPVTCLESSDIASLIHNASHVVTFA